MSNQLVTDLNLIGDGASVKLSGRINEDSDFSKIENLKAKSYVFDFKEVEAINSCGIREWINYLGSLGKNVKIEYHNCPQIIIEQINMVKGFIPEGAKVVSFFAPYFCSSCDSEKSLFMNASEIVNKKAPVKKCPECNTEEMEFDALEAQYFHFLK